MGFNNIAALTSYDSPAKIVAGNSNDLYALIGSDIYTIFQYPVDYATNTTTISTPSSYTTSVSSESVVNVSDGIPFDIPIARSSPTYKFLQIGWDETQASGESWCMAYTTASILRFKTGNDVDTINARSIMEWAYPDLSLSDLKKEALSTSEADAFANTFGIDPRYTSSRRSYSQVVSDIKADNPLVFICDNLNTGKKERTLSYVGATMTTTKTLSIPYGILGMMNLSEFTQVIIFIPILMDLQDTSGVLLCTVGTD